MPMRGCVHEADPCRSMSIMGEWAARFRHIVVGLLPFEVACGGAGDDVARRVDELRAEQQRRQVELALLDQKIQAARLEHRAGASKSWGTAA